MSALSVHSSQCPIMALTVPWHKRIMNPICDDRPWLVAKEEYAYGLILISETFSGRNIIETSLVFWRNFIALLMISINFSGMIPLVSLTTEADKKKVSVRVCKPTKCCTKRYIGRQWSRLRSSSSVMEVGRQMTIRSGYSSKRRPENRSVLFVLLRESTFASVLSEMDK